MKAVLLSEKPKWCDLIASGKKTIEVRKTRPKIDTPFKVFIYATKPKDRWSAGCLVFYNDDLWLVDGKVEMRDGCKFMADGTKCERLNGKVIGEFVCDEIIPIVVFENGTIQYWNANNLEDTCLDYDKLAKYIGFGKTGYAWHISALKIYDKPRELSDFKKPCIMSEQPYCPCCEYGEVFHTDDEIEYALYHNGYVDSCEWHCLNIIKNAPQSWCYVEYSEVK